ncbi:MAG TPA: hypothetical protein VFO44_09095, partial [Steroidobacteraceae bacterium]|nr:hypothetical protein [Steroidobacteraceae bacterium]
GLYPYVIPFSGAAMATDSTLAPYTVHERREVRGTGIVWEQPAKILPVDTQVRATILQIESAYEELLADLQRHSTHLPSRVRSLLWILASLPAMAAHGLPVADATELRRELATRLPQSCPAAAPQVASA